MNNIYPCFEERCYIILHSLSRSISILCGGIFFDISNEGIIKFMLKLVTMIVAHKELAREEIRNLFIFYRPKIEKKKKYT